MEDGWGDELMFDVSFHEVSTGSDSDRVAAPAIPIFLTNCDPVGIAPGADLTS